MTYELPKTGYLTFDAFSLRQLILDKLNQEGTFTDQNYIGSNLSSYIDIVAHSFHTLIYYLNQTGSEAMFSEAQLYENINKIVKVLDYNPIGFQSSTLSFSASAGEDLEPGSYTIPRYSYINVNSIPFSFVSDVTFSKSNVLGLQEELSNFSSSHLLYQGQYVESPTHTAAGDKNEAVILLPENSTHSIDHFRIDVYVKESDNKWYAYEKASSLYLEPGPVKKYEIRLNDKKEYEIRFGDDINGRRLKAGEKVVIYSLQSTKPNPIGPFELKSTMKFFKKNTPTLVHVLDDTKASAYASVNQLHQLLLTNPNAATDWSDGESVSDIKQKAPALFRAQYRAVTKSDYLAFIKANYSRFLQDADIIDNWEYTSSYLRYYYDTLKLGDPVNAGGERALMNHINYSDPVHFNNIYVVGVPRFTSAASVKYLSPAQKSLIKTDLNEVKTLTSNICFLDPVYKYVSFAIPGTSVAESVLDTKLVITKNARTTVNAETIRAAVAKEIFSFLWHKDNMRLGGTVFFPNLAQRILQIAGIEKFHLTNGTATTPDLVFACWNPQYSSLDYIYTSQNLQLRPFEFPLLLERDTEELERRIEIV